MSASDAGSSDSMAMSSPTFIPRIASRLFTIGMGQKRPMQSISLSGMSTFGAAAMARYGILAVRAASRQRASWHAARQGPMAQSTRTSNGRPEEPTPVAGGARRTIMLALCLTSFIPLPAPAYGFSAYSPPLPASTQRTRALPWPEALLVFTGLLMVVGGLLIWDVTRALPRRDDPLPVSPPLPEGLTTADAG